MASAAVERIRQRVGDGRRPAAAPDSDWAWARRLTVIVGVLTLAGTLLGFGTARAYESMFGLSYGLWFDSPLDLLILSSDAVFGLVHAICSGFTGPDLWRQTGTFSLMVTGFACIPVAGKWAASNPGIQPWRTRVAAKLVDLTTWLTTNQTRLTGNIGRATVAMTLSFSAIWLSVLGGIGLLAFALSVVCAVPLLGIWGATAYARAAIVEPESCISPLPARLHATKTRIGAPCVEVRDPSTGASVVGLQILARGNRIFLYSKEQGRGLMLSTKDASIFSRSQDTP
jgi:hypothetical protein